MLAVRQEKLYPRFLEDNHMIPSLDLMRDHSTRLGHCSVYSRNLGDGSTSERLAYVLPTLHLEDVLLAVKLRHCRH